MPATVLNLKPRRQRRLGIPRGIVSAWAFFSHDGKRVYVGGQGLGVRHWDADTFAPIRHVKRPIWSYGRADLHPTLPLIASGGERGHLYVRDANTGGTVLSCRRHRDGVQAVRFYADGTALASAGNDGTVRRTDAASGKPIPPVKRLWGPAHRLAVSADGSVVAALYQSGVRAWDAAGNELLRFAATYYHGGEIQQDVVVSRDGSRLWVAFRGDTQLRCWGLRDGAYRLLHSRRLGEAAFSLALSPDERLLAVGCNVYVVLVASRSCREVCRWAGAPEIRGWGRPHVGHLSFRADGRRLLSTSQDATVRLWDVSV